MATGQTAKLHSAARTAALKRWRESHPQEWDDLWRLLQPMIRAQNPDASSRRVWSLTTVAMRSNIIESHPQEWATLREEVLADLKREAEWNPRVVTWSKDRRREQGERMRALRRALVPADEEQ